MNAAGWLWSLRALEKFAFLGVPAIVTLLFWKKRGVGCARLYRASWANPSVYLVWLLAMAIVAILSHHAAFRWMVFSFLPSSLAFLCPFLLSVGSLILCVFCIRTKPSERPFAVLPNLLMLVLWWWSIVGPN